ncbi:AAA family ATPase [Nitrospira sp. BLG_1]|uniref:AAA family ATPase n=1 Tax=Nitrospira sp. BLG_1 TaxID=3395883 RepID=UPI0039BD3B0D
MSPVNEKIAKALSELGISLPEPPARVVHAPKSKKTEKSSSESTTSQTEQTEQGDKPIHVSLIMPVEPTDYVEPDWAQFLFNVWDDMDDTPGVMVDGPRGTGKTQAVMVYAARRNKPLLVCNCNQEMTPDSLLGSPRIDMKGVGGDYLQMGPIALAAKLGAVLFMDEVNYLPPATQAVNNPLMDTVQNGIFLPYTGERIEWENPKIVAAFNSGYAGTREINQAFFDRFEPLVAEYLPLRQEATLIVNRTGCEYQLAERAVRTANAIRAAAKGDNGNVMPLEFDLSPRALFSFARRVVSGKQDINRAWKEAVIGRVGSGIRRSGARETVRQLSIQIGNFQV